MGKIIPRGKNPAGGEHIEIEYAPPLLGFDTSARPPYVRPNALAGTRNFLLSDNQYLTYSWQNNGSLNTGSETFLGSFDINGTVYLCTFGTVGGTTGVIVYEVNYFAPASLSFINIVAATDGQVYGFLTYIIINNLVYISFQKSDTIYVFDQSIPAISILTNFIGGEHLAELNGRLIVTNVWQTVGGFLKHFPYQMAWSAANQAYSQFNPVVGGLVTGAGFNNIPDVEDTITGIITTGPTAYIIRQRGITEVTPLNNGVEPFDFNHLWASHKGIGTVLPNTISQYGSLGVFVAEDDIYTIGYDGINVITGFAKSGIYNYMNNLINNPTNPVQGVLSSMIIDNNPTLCYILSISYSSAIDPGFHSLFIYSFTLKEWMFIQIPVQNFPVVTGSYISAHNLTFGNLNSAFSNIIFWEITGFGTNLFMISNQPALSTDSNTVSRLVFPAEEVVFGRDVTIDGIALYLSTKKSMTIDCSINGISFNTIHPVDGTNIYFIWPTNGLPFTGKFPQLILTAQSTATLPDIASLSVSKISLFGTVNPEQRPL